MATNFDKSNNNFQHVSVPFNYQRGNPMPLDNDEVWQSFEAAQEYARTSPIAYVGQVLNVVENGDGKCFMIINANGDLKDIDSKSTQLLVSVKYAELTAMIASNELIPGCQYRITDYVATTNKDSMYAVSKKTLKRRQLLKAINVSDSAAEFDIDAIVYRSANKQFDIIVTADDNHTLNENARCIKHEFDDSEIDIFEGCKLESWQIKYSIYNDTMRFAWADDTQHGKGVIYQMKDEYGNEAPYDFKGILFGIYEPNENIYEGMTLPDYYTFSFIHSGYTDDNDTNTYYEEVYDDTGKFIQNYTDNIELRPYQNKIAPYISNGKQYLNGVVFMHCDPTKAGPCRNEFKENCAVCICYWAEECNDNKFGIGCQLILIGLPLDVDSIQCNGTARNKFEDYCTNIILDYTCYDITIGKHSYAIAIGYECRNVEIGEMAFNINIQSNCNDIRIGNKCNTIQLSKNNSMVVIEADCENIELAKPLFKNVVVQQNNKGMVLDTLADNSYTMNIEIQQGCCQNVETTKTLLVEDEIGNQNYKTTFTNSAAIIKIVD